LRERCGTALVRSAELFDDPCAFGGEVHAFDSGHRAESPALAVPAQTLNRVIATPTTAALCLILIVTSSVDMASRIRLPRDRAMTGR
jgi:hypothetical protein